ncbi:hypothetical protein CONPUDRAFT_150485 [Coniophora puteana RWD-64-598 SS2]|uniref:Uncharacterized protein n=1 Tax=Coniophora puteana (strain RWD-64-598) TaxID=741705 RepID=A0A5M3N2S8_CONPW|nr:uncharacterized protein CONPUDRAFT_150485 [Coniophora puteana RWD-64-598 SS2]EIW85690.1 hypothetical protein CONPUDRAFT_150485 [Coniophora puteana RWD-64-598 SS2]
MQLSARLLALLSFILAAQQAFAAPIPCNDATDCLIARSGIKKGDLDLLPDSEEYARNKSKRAVPGVKSAYSDAVKSVGVRVHDGKYVNTFRNGVIPGIPSGTLKAASRRDVTETDSSFDELDGIEDAHDYAVKHNLLHHERDQAPPGNNGSDPINGTKRDISDLEPSPAARNTAPLATDAHGAIHHSRSLVPPSVATPPSEEKREEPDPLREVSTDGYLSDNGTNDLSERLVDLD